MSRARYRQIAEVGARGIFFGCGHCFIQAAENVSLLVKYSADGPRCPICYDDVCPACLAPFSEESDTCDSCSQFCEFSTIADKALAKGIYRIRLEYGILMVPSVGSEWTQVLDWPDSLCLGAGYIDFEHDIDTNGEIYACGPLKFDLYGITQIDEQGNPGQMVLEAWKTEFRIVDVGET
ncbi:hypothetical protein F4806DRAFT_50333 [Annulohypoxylon nitens]|nr:hypothetical protein F4806DRAFT_50333 [Annulohypoxylon nitens]